MENFKVSVVIAMFNAEKFINETVISVLNQTFTPHEIIIVNDGSTDKSLDAVDKIESKMVKLISQTNQGAAVARNLGVKNSKGNFIAFLDADDIWKPKKLELQIEAFKKDLQLDFLFTNVLQFQHEGTTGRLKREHSVMPGIIPSTFIAKKSSYEKVGIQKNDLKVGEFLDWFIRAKDMGFKHSILDEILVRRRIHEDNLGVRKKKERIDYFRALKYRKDRKLQINKSID